jgi:predicted acetyltransferase
LFVDYFFKNKYKKENAVYKELNGQIVSALHLIEKKINIGGLFFDCPFIAAAATDKEHRNKGYMAEIIKQSFQRLFDNGYCITALNPFDYRFYAKFGFAAFCYAKEEVVDFKAGGNYSLTKLTEKDFYKLTETAKAFLTVEMSMGQMIDDVKLSTRCLRPVSLFSKTGGLIPNAAEIAKAAKKAFSSVM